MIGRRRFCCTFMMSVVLILCLLFINSSLFAQESTQQVSEQVAPQEAKEGVQAINPEGAAGPKQETMAADEAALSDAGQEALTASGNVTLDFKDADIRNILKIISYKAGVNIVTTPEVMGNVTIRLVDVPWDKALDVILKTYGFGYERIGNIITVAPIDKLTALKRQEVELAQVQPTITEVFNLKFIDAQDARKAIDSQISSRGRVTVLDTTGQAGWEFGSGELGKRRRAAEGRVSRSKTLIVSDIPPVLDKVKEILRQIDVRPQQILIEAKLVEVNHDKLQEVGFNFGSGTGGPASLTTHRDEATYYETMTDPLTGEVTQKQFKDIVTLPTLPFSSKGTSIYGAQSLPWIGVGEFVFQKLTGTEFEAVFKALEEKGYANTLSAPHIMTLNNQEAAILIGKKFPLLKSTVSTESGALTGQSLDRYQDIGIQLNVAPQVAGQDSINLIIHPAVSSYTQTVKATTPSGIVMAEYPIIITREAETQVLMKSGETVVIGGLLTDAKTRSSKGIPILKDIPLLGLLFQQRSDTVEKLDLLIFITARFVGENDFNPEEIAKLEKRLERGTKTKAKKVPKVTNKK